MVAQLTNAAGGTIWSQNQPLKSTSVALSATDLANLPAGQTGHFILIAISNAGHRSSASATITRDVTAPSLVSGKDIMLRWQGDASVIANALEAQAALGRLGRVFDRRLKSGGDRV